LTNWIRLFDETDVHRTDPLFSILKGTAEDWIAHQISATSHGRIGCLWSFGGLPRETESEGRHPVGSAWEAMAAKPGADIVRATYIQVPVSLREQIHAPPRHCSRKHIATHGWHCYELLERGMQALNNLFEQRVHRFFDLPKQPV
jgi:hypothetical protein